MGLRANQIGGALARQDGRRSGDAVTAARDALTAARRLEAAISLRLDSPDELEPMDLRRLGSALQSARANRIAAERELLDLERETGELVYIAEAKESISLALGEGLKLLASLPTRISARLAGLTGGEIEDILQGEVDRVLTMIRAGVEADE